MKIVQTILQRIGKLSKPQQKFILVLFSSIFILCGKVTFTNLSRYSSLSERTYRRQFSKTLDWHQFNQYLIEQAIDKEARKLAVIDCSFISKSGKLTYGAKRKFDGKVNLPDISRLSFVREIDANVYLYTARVWHVSLQRNIRMAYLVDYRNLDKIGYALLFSTDNQLDAYDLYCYYKARFQIEFIFRDAKQFTGLADCQARDQKKLDFHFNASLTALNLAKFEQKQCDNGSEPFVFSMASYKRLALNEHLLETFISKLDLSPTLIKSHPNYEQLRSLGAIAA